MYNNNKLVKEKAWIKTYDAYEKGYNSLNKGYQGYKHTKETKDKLSKLRIGVSKNFSEEHLNNIRLSKLKEKGTAKKGIPTQIINSDTGEVMTFISLGEASRVTGLGRRHLSESLVDKKQGSDKTFPNNKTIKAICTHQTIT